MREYFRKKIAGLKRSPQNITMVLILIACAICTFSLMLYSQTSEGLYTDSYRDHIVSQNPGFVFPWLYRNPAIFIFINVLFSFLLPISFISVYKKGKVNSFMFSIVICMVVLMIACDTIYILAINFYTSEPWLIGDNRHQQAIIRSIIHLISLVLVLTSILIRPYYKKLLAKIDTSVDDEYDILMDQKTDEELMFELGDDK